jgi:MFS family permease
MASFLARVYAFQFFDSFILIFPLYVVMFADAGLSPVQIAIVLIAWSVTAFVLNVPAGVVADRWSRGLVLTLAQFARALCFVIWWAWPHFWGFLVGLMFWGVKSAFTGGTFEALLYDELKAAGAALEYPKIYGRSRALKALAIILASLGAAVVAPLGYGTTLAASLAAVGASVGAAASLPRVAKAVESRERDYLGHLRQGLTLAVGNRAVFGILAFSAGVLALGGALEEFWPIFGAKVGLSRSMIAIFVGAQQAVEAVGSLTAHRLARARLKWFHGLFTLAGGLLIAAAVLFSAPAMALLALYSGAMRLLDVAFEGRLQHAIPSENRATIGSVKGFFGEVGVTGLYMGLGPLAQATSYRTAFTICGMAGVAIGATFLAAGARPR